LFGRILTVGKIYIDIYSSQNDCRVMFLADGLFHFPVPAVSGALLWSSERNLTMSTETHQEGIKM
jgi:hypothetical protein